MDNEFVQDLDQRIRERAYRIWIDEGCPEGRADDHWRQAADALDLEEQTLEPLTDPVGEAPATLPPNH